MKFASDRTRRLGSRTTLVVLNLLILGCSAVPDADSVPEEVIRHNILGTAYLGQQKWDDATAAFDRALALRPKDALLLTNAAVARNQQGRTDEAIALLQQALEQEPTDLHANYNLGLIESRSGDFDTAVKRFDEVARQDPQDLFTQYYLGSALSRVDREQEAIEAYRRALELDPAHVSSLYGLGRLLLQRGAQQEGTELITVSQAIRARSGLDEAVGGQYGEQGPYSLGQDYPGNVLAAPDPIPLQFRPLAQIRLQPSPLGPAWATARAAGGGGPQIFVGQQASVLQLFPPGVSEPIAPPAPETRAIVRMAGGDFDNDGLSDLFVLLGGIVTAENGALSLEPRPALLMQDAGGGFRWQAAVDASPGEAGVARVTGLDLAVVDRDHDGDLDAFWCWADDGGGDCRLATNDGKAGLRLTTAADSGFDLGRAAAGPLFVRVSDLDNDRDIDLLVGTTNGVHLLSNQRDGTFKDVSAGIGLGSPVDGLRGMEIADIDKDGWMDLLLAGEAGVHLQLNRRGRLEPPVPLGAVDGAGAATGLLVIDVDNDGFLDLFAAGSGLPHLYHNRGAGRWNVGDQLLQSVGPGSRPVVAFDGDADGDLDLVTVHADGNIALLSNEGGNSNHWIELAAIGIGDNRYGVGTKVEVLAGALRQKFEITGPLPIHAGLGHREQVQSARFRWPSGVLQDEVELEGGRIVEITQLDRKGTSCPLLYAWRDGHWRFVTDFLGGSAIGYLHAPGQYGTPDTDEYVLIEGGMTPDERGRLKLRANNQLQEVIWFDHAELVVVDHPQGTEVYPDERLMPGPPFPEFALYASREIRPIVAARGIEDRSDQTAALAQRDRRYVMNFERLPYKGYAQMHTLELDLGPIEAGRRIVLLLDGWIDYADSSSNLAAAQAGSSLMSPTLQVADGRSGWRDIEGLMGFPAGLPKTMTVELTGRFPSGDHRIRIATNMRIYWDRARVLVGGEGIPLEVQRLTAESAELRFGGFPRETSADGKPPFAYDPDERSSHSPWNAHAGRYTPFGDVSPLLERIDDRFVTTRNGDEIELRFPAPRPLAPGRTRTFLLYADGFGKDMDPNSAASAEIRPIPFHGMPGYPYASTVAPPVLQDHLGRAPRLIPESPDGDSGTTPAALLPRAGAAH